MYFLVNASPPKPLDVATLNFADALVRSKAGIHTGQCKRTGGCYNELVVAFLRTGGGLKGKKIYTC